MHFAKRKVIDMQTSAKERMLAAQAQYEQIKSDNAELKKFRDSLDQISERMGNLLEYYESMWMEDMDLLYKEGENIEVMGQDPIYDEIVEQDQVIKEILLKCAEYIN